MSDKKSFLDGLFDLNGDGKADLGEQYIAYRIFEEMTKPDSEKDDDLEDVIDEF